VRVQIKEALKNIEDREAMSSASSSMTAAGRMEQLVCPPFFLDGGDDGR